jgi:dTDP-4-dehydrorhamnose 3,5-epimerase
MVTRGASGMQFIETELPGVIRVRPKLIGDQRGFFMEFYHRQRFREQGIDAEFVQDNLSRSERGVLRGLHYQVRQPQGKLVTVLAGEIFDVAVDLRRRSPRFGEWMGVRLTDRTREALYLPPGFAHGFYVLSETADVFYKCTDLYAPEHERTLLWNDPEIGIDWPLSGEPTLSEKDRRGTPLQEADCFD